MSSTRLFGSPTIQTSLGPVNTLGSSMNGFGGTINPSSVNSYQPTLPPLPRAQWCRAGIRPSKVLAIPAGAGFMIEVAFTRGWAPSREVDLTFTLELA